MMTSPQRENSPNGFNKGWENFKNKINTKLQECKGKEKFEKACLYIKNNKWDGIVGGLVIAGIIISLFKGFLGGLLIGIAIGIYFYKELMIWALELCSDKMCSYSSKCLILGGMALGLFIAAPGIVIGAIVTVAIMRLFKF